METKTVTDGEFKGWFTWPGEPFEHDTAGPFYMRQDEDGSMVAAFRAQRKHMNAGGVVHGGALMTFAEEMRTFRELKAQEKANKLPVQMSAVLAMLMLPAIVMLSLAPVVIRYLQYSAQ